ncbi:MAG: hypothetical protein OK439_03440 [Thaumarchaeota archaeon]|nr:hypothetical protein [Nitrososphaerota archaeon]
MSIKSELNIELLQDLLLPQELDEFKQAFYSNSDPQNQLLISLLAELQPSITMIKTDYDPNLSPLQKRLLILELSKALYSLPGTRQSRLRV